MMRRLAVLAIGIVLISGSAKSEDAPDDVRPAAATVSLQDSISRCLSAPPGRAKVRIAFVLKADGTVDGTPRILDGAGDRQGKTFALSAIRAILRCTPYQGAPTGEVVATFSQTAD